MAFPAMAAIVVLLLLLPFADAETPWQLCGSRGNYTAGSNYQSNLNQLSAALPRGQSIRVRGAWAAAAWLPAATACFQLVDFVLRHALEKERCRFQAVQSQS